MISSVWGESSKKSLVEETSSSNLRMMGEEGQQALLFEALRGTKE